MEKLGENAISWLDGDISTQTPEIIAEETAIGTLVIIIVSAIISITLLFVMAVFIDCRHQKLAKNKQTQPPKRILRIPLPSFLRPRESEDQESFADKMQTEEAASSSPTVIVQS